MTLSTTTSRTNYIGTGSTGPFAIPFRITKSADLLVTKRSATGIETTLVLTTDYTVDPALANVTTTLAVATGETLFIRRKPALTQPMSIRNQGAYFPATIEDEEDLLVMQLQSLSDTLDRCVKLKETINGGASLTELEPTAGYVVTGTGTGFTMSALNTSATALPGAGRNVTTLSAYLANNAVFNVLDFANGQPVNNGVLDATAAIDAADAACALNAGQLTGGGTASNGRVFFPAGKYKHTGLTYRGVPWWGAGFGATTLLHYTTGGWSVDAVGTNVARRIMDIRDMTFDGTNAAAGTSCIKLGYNMRSLPAMRSCRIQNYNGFAFYHKADNWILSFYDIDIQWCAGGVFGYDVAVTALVDFYWNAVIAEINGTVASGLPAIDLTAVCTDWNFFGGNIEDNKGLCQVRLTNCNGIKFFGTYFESVAGEVSDSSILITGSSIATLYGNNITTGPGTTGKAVRVIGTANVTIDSPYGYPNWPVMLSVEDTAQVTLLSEGKNFTPITVANGATFIRTTPKPVVLVDGATIPVDLSLGTIFSVTLAASGHVLSNPINGSVGQIYTFRILQDAVGGRALSLGTFYKNTWVDTGNTAFAQSTFQAMYINSRMWPVGPQTPYTS